MKQVSRRLCIWFVVIAMGVLLTACTNNASGTSTDGLDVTKKTVPFQNCEEGFTFQNVDSVDLYYVNGGSVPYIDVMTYFQLIDPVSRMEQSDFTFEEDRIVIEYHPVLYQYMFFDQNQDYDTNENITFRMEINFETEEVIVSDYLFFLYQGMPMMDFKSDVITITDVEIQKGTDVVIPFGEYGIHFVVDTNDEASLYLLPFHVATLLFTNSTLYRTYYNGDTVYAGGRCIYYQDVRSSSYSGEDVPLDVREASFNLFTISLDYFSAIKQAREVESYRTLLMRNAPTITSTPSHTYYTELTKLLYKVDDMHADLPANGYYAKDPMETITTYPSWFSTNRRHYWDTWGAYTAAFVNQYGDFNNWPTVRLLDNETTAVLHLYQFTTTTQEVVKSYLDSLPESIENVVLDISINGGGNVNAIFQVLSFMTDEPITFTNGIAIDGSSIRYTVSMEQPAYPYKWYIKTSNVTYSAGNILALLASDNDVATLIGESTMGGASVIESILLPCGFTHTISGNYTFYSNESSAEYGVPVDVRMNNVWDEVEMIDIITKSLD